MQLPGPKRAKKLTNTPAEGTGVLAVTDSEKSLRINKLIS